MSLLSHKRIRLLLLAQWLPPACVAAVESLIIPYTKSARTSTALAGLLLACPPAGMITGDLIAGRLLDQRIRSRLVIPLMTATGIAFLPFAMSPSAAVAGILLAIAGLGHAYLLALQQPFREAVSEPMLGQAFTLLGTGVMVVQGVGPLLFGLAADSLPLGVVIATAGAAVLVITAFLAPGIRSARR